MPPATTEIRTQADMDRLFAGIVDSFESISWEGWMQQKMRQMEAIHETYWQSQAGPTGAPWPANAPSTIKRKKHSVILVDKLVLRPAMTKPFAEGAIRMTIDQWPKATMIFGNDLFYSPIHNEGLLGQKKREHIGVTIPFFETMASSATDHAFERIKK